MKHVNQLHKFTTSALDRCTYLMKRDVSQLCLAVHTESLTHFCCVMLFRVPVISPRFHLISQPVTWDRGAVVNSCYSTIIQWRLLHFFIFPQKTFRKLFPSVFETKRHMQYLIKNAIMYLICMPLSHTHKAGQAVLQRSDITAHKEQSASLSSAKCGAVTYELTCSLLLHQYNNFQSETQGRKLDAGTLVSFFTVRDLLSFGVHDQPERL